MLTPINITDEARIVGDQENGDNAIGANQDPVVEYMILKLSGATRSGSEGQAADDRVDGSFQRDPKYQRQPLICSVLTKTQDGGSTSPRTTAAEASGHMDAFSLYSNDNYRMMQLLGLLDDVTDTNDAQARNVDWRQIAGLPRAHANNESHQEEQDADPNNDGGYGSEGDDQNRQAGQVRNPAGRKTRLSVEVHNMTLIPSVQILPQN